MLFTEYDISARPITTEGFLGTVVQRCSVKSVFLEISQNSQENTYARVFF